MNSDKKITSHVVTLTPEQCVVLENLLRERGWEFAEQPYAHWKALRDKTNVVAYKSGKLTVQGAGCADFVAFILEPEILHSYGFGYEVEPEVTETFDAHGGIDESGKGDFFGPLVIAGVVLGPENGPKLRAAGVRDSKAIHSAARIAALAGEIRRLAPNAYSVIALMPETYNSLYEKVGNLNRLLAWGHARVIENLLEKKPDCPRMLSDKFADERLIQRALMERGKKIALEQRVRAESDVAVAAASILAREHFLKKMEQLSLEAGIILPRGGGSEARKAGEALFRRGGTSLLARCVKTHFKTFSEITTGTQIHEN